MERWKDLEIKSKIAYTTALLAFVVGWGLTIAGFIFPPLGVVADSVLWILGQALLYCASVFGVGLYVTSSVKSMRRNIQDFMREEDMRFRQGEEINKDNDTEDFTL